MDAAGFVLAGGQSSRMGVDKALVEFRGRPLVDHALAALRRAGLTVAIAGARTGLQKYAPVIDDLDSGQGPLGGICAALEVTNVTWAVFVPVDLPLLPASLIELLQKRAQITDRTITVTSVNGFVETFPAILHQRALPALKAELAAGRRGCFAAFKTAAGAQGEGLNVVAAELLVQTGQVKHPEGLPPVRWFWNVNSSEDLKRAEEYLPDPAGGPHRVS